MDDEKNDLKDPSLNRVDNENQNIRENSDIEAILEAISHTNKRAVKEVNYEDLNLGHRNRLKSRFLNSPRRTLQDYEILEMMLFCVIPRRDTKPLAKVLLNKFGTIAGVVFADDSALKTIPGIGDSVVFLIKLMADFFSRICIPQKKGEVHVLSSWMAVIHYCQMTMGFKKSESYRVLFLNKKNVLIGDEFIEAGTVDKIAIYPREISKMSLLHGAVAIILVHNHPSGDPTPSKEDIEITKRIVAALIPINVTLHDHLIVAEHKHFSFKASGLI
jgi:DNA repair protein RadC